MSYASYDISGNPKNAPILKILVILCPELNI